jgi:hypothetical protein
MADTVAKAERMASTRATLFYLLAAAFAASAIMGIGAHHLVRMLTWMLLGVLTALNLTPLPQWLRPGPVATLLNDESTREHRRTALVTGFWAGVTATLALFGCAEALGLNAQDVARFIAAAALSSALATFAFLEQRASRG